MLSELVVRNLGVIDQVSIRLPTGLIALTGETGAGKTLLIDAINLLLGGRADSGLVKHGETEATVDGRFEIEGEEEVLLSRVVAAKGRSRAYIDGRPVTVAALAEIGQRLIDLHGQHSHQALLGASAQRDALDRFGQIDVARVVAAKTALAELQQTLGELGGDERTRARELDLLRYQVDELEAAAIVDSAEDERLMESEELLSNAVAHQDACRRVLDDVNDDDGIRDRLVDLVSTLETRQPFDSEAARLRDLLAELDDIVDSVRSVGEGIDPDPSALNRVHERQHLLQQLRRKYGDSLEDVLTEQMVLAARLEELEDHDARAATLDSEIYKANEELSAASSELLEARCAVAPALARLIQEQLPSLAMDKARVGISVSGDDGSTIVFELAANPGTPMQPLSKVASGGELARAMLALRSVLSDAPPILVFDEVDAGIGGEVGTAVGSALAELGKDHQVLVVTHLPQVAAFADAHLVVDKRQSDDDTVSDVKLLDKQARIVELARMLAGQPDSKTARTHAKELVSKASKAKAPSGTASSGRAKTRTKAKSG